MSINNTNSPLVSEKENLTYWNEFYKKFNLDEASTFCRYINAQINKNTTIVDIGCGTGRDTRTFAKSGYQVVGIDRAEEAIAKNNNYIKKIEGNHLISFKVIDISNEDELSMFLNDTAESAVLRGNQLLIYTRFFLHSINKETEEILLRIISNCLNTGDMFAAEFRTKEDKHRDKFYSDHYRRYIDSDLLVHELEQNYQFKVIQYSKGTGYSIYKNEDPYLARIFVEKI